MIWRKTELHRFVDSGEYDKLGNAIKTDELVAETYARVTPWTNVDTVVDGREFTVNDRKFLIRIPFKKFPECDTVIVDCKDYKISEIQDLGKFTLLYAKNTKGGLK